MPYSPLISVAEQSGDRRDRCVRELESARKGEYCLLQPPASRVHIVKDGEFKFTSPYGHKRVNFSALEPFSFRGLVRQSVARTPSPVVNGINSHSRLCIQVLLGWMLIFRRACLELSCLRGHKARKSHKIPHAGLCLSFPPFMVEVSFCTVTPIGQISTLLAVETHIGEASKVSSVLDSPVDRRLSAALPPSYITLSLSLMRASAGPLRPLGHRRSSWAP